ncbi:MAG: sulfotransferase [Thiotrichaceae bacterium]
MEPIEQLIPELIGVAANSYLGHTQAIQNIRLHSGVIPIAIFPSNHDHKVVWLDVGHYQFTEWKFKASIKNLTKNQSECRLFTTDIQLLTSNEIITDCLYPSAFIFHMSKCGSTLLARALAQSPHHIVMTEASPLHENLWQYLTHDWQQPVTTTENLTLIKNAILAMGRRRTAEQQAYFVKFRSWNVIFIETIMRAFPDVPCLFLYRNPSEVLVSSTRELPMGQFRLKGTAAAAFMLNCSTTATAEMSHLDYFKNLHERYFAAALNLTGGVTYLNYNQLSKQNFAKILQQTFRYTTTADQMILMQNQFDYYSKDDKDSTRFISDTEKKQKAVTPEIRAAVEQKLAVLYEQLEQSDRNFTHK